MHFVGLEHNITLPLALYKGGGVIELKIIGNNYRPYIHHIFGDELILFPKLTLCMTSSYLPRLMVKKAICII